MKSRKPGTSTCDVEVTNISAHGFWLFVEGKEYFLSYEEFPWFKEAKVADILNVQLHHKSHLHWPALDVDLCVESLENPGAYPLVFHGEACKGKKEKVKT